MTVPAPTSRALKLRARRVEEAKRFSLPPVKTLATMTEHERREMLRLYGAGAKRAESR
jgi:hypothetical protein